MKKYFNVFCLALFLGALLLCLKNGIPFAKQIWNETKRQSESKKVVVLDPGHGGFDPGKVGVNHSLEKDINLLIAKKVKVFLQENDIEVIMTREEDIGLYAEGDSNKKTADMRKRVQIINESNPALAVSIHQNSYSQESCKGAQVFYHVASEEGKIFANIMQTQMKDIRKEENKREAKANDNYYMLKKTNVPIIIVEYSVPNRLNHLLSISFVPCAV